MQIFVGGGGQLFFISHFVWFWQRIALKKGLDLEYLASHKKFWGDTNFVFEIKRVENYPNFDKSVLVNRHGLSDCYLKNVTNDSL